MVYNSAVFVSTTFGSQIFTILQTALSITNSCVIKNCGEIVLLSFREGQMSDSVAIALIVAVAIIVVLLIVRNRVKSIGGTIKPTGEIDAKLTAYKAPSKTGDNKGGKTTDNSKMLQIGIANKIRTFIRDKFHIIQMGRENEIDIGLDVKDPKKRK